jgi:hypothetical protein
MQKQELIENESSVTSSLSIARYSLIVRKGSVAVRVYRVINAKRGEVTNLAGSPQTRGTMPRLLPSLNFKLMKVTSRFLRRFA